MDLSDIVVNFHVSDRHGNPLQQSSQRGLISAGLQTPEDFEIHDQYGRNTEKEDQI